jgi:hypothetical protein
MQHVDLRIGAAATALTIITLSACSTPPAAPVGLSAAPVGLSAAPVELSAAPVELSAVVPVSPADDTLAAPQPPPPIRAEIPPPAPSAQALWRFGHWSWNGSKFLWTPGRYVERPSPAASWVPGYWEQRPEGWIRVDGQWTS